MGEKYEYQHSPSEIAAFESEHRILLPDSYRAYLMEFPWREGSVLSPLSEWCQPHMAKQMPDGFLAKPFPHSQAWNETHLFDRTRGWDSEYYAVRYFQGSMRVFNFGCEEYGLLVVSGPERGNIWIDARVSRQAGIYPMLDSGSSVSFALFMKMYDKR